MKKTAQPLAHKLSLAGAVLVCNFITWYDALLLGMKLPTQVDSVINLERFV
jgi:hypothetical protein